MECVWRSGALFFEKSYRLREGAVLFWGKWTGQNDVENALCKSLISMLISDISYLF
jgi:hypothetical protein